MNQNFNFNQHWKIELPEIKGPFTLQKIFGMARIKMGGVPKELVLISHLHVLFSSVLNSKKGFYWLNF